VPLITTLPDIERAARERTFPVIESALICFDSVLTVLNRRAAPMSGRKRYTSAGTS
jgi:hypothetical protein